MPYENKKLVKLLHCRKWEEAAGLLKSDEGKALAKQADNNGYLPLHELVLQKPSPGQQDSYARFLESLVDVFPDGLKTNNKYGSLPIHVAMTCGSCGVSGIRKMIVVYPQGLKEKNKNGNLPIHLALKKPPFCYLSEVVTLLIDKHPEGLKTKNSDGDLPIHGVGVGMSPIEIIRKLADGYPNGLKEKNKQGNLPIHDAVKRYPDNHLKSGILGEFIRRYPEGLKNKNKEGNLPIHLAAAQGKIESTVLLAKQYPGGIKTKNKHGNLPIHMAAFYGLDAKAMGKIVDLYPQGLQSENNDGQLPIHLAIPKRSSNIDVLNLLVPRNSESFSTRNNKREQLEDDKRQLQEDKTALEGTVEKLKDENLQLEGELASEKEKVVSFQGKLATMVQATVKGRQSEIGILSLLDSENEAAVSLEGVKFVGRSLKARLDELQAKTQPSSTPCWAQDVFSSVIKDPDVSRASLIRVIDTLNKELSKVESQYINGKAALDTVESANRDGRNRTHALDLSSLNTPEQASKKARVKVEYS